MPVGRRERRPGAGGHYRAERPGDVAQVGKRARQMAVFDVEVEVPVVAAPDRLDEVCKVLLVAATRPLAQFVAVVVEGDAGGVVRPDGKTLGAIPDVAGAGERCDTLQTKCHR